MEGLKLVRGIWLAGLVVAAAPTPRQVPPLFTDDERKAVVAYWAEPDRYRQSLPAEADRNGPFQVRLTVAGSIWIREYNRVRGLSKVPPTANASPQNDEQKAWQQWIDAKIERDRWLAMQTAEQSNRKLTTHDTKFDDRSLPKSEPADPGPAPEGLLLLAGDPPKFAEAVVPMLHVVTFDDGSEISFVDNCRMRKNYPYYRFEHGVASEGTTVKTMPAGHVEDLCKKAGLTDTELRVMKSVSMLEGGFDAVNTYDTGFVSVGFIQFATLKDGGNSLGAMLKVYKDQDPGNFQRDFRRFGIDVTPDSKLACVDPGTGAELSGEAAVRKVIDDKRLIAVFEYDGEKSDAYNAMQLRAAKDQFYPSDDPLSITVNGQTLSGKVSDVFQSEAGLATLMDRKVNTGRLDPLQTTLEQFASANGATSLNDLAKFEFDIVGSMKYRRDFLADTSLTQPLATVRSKPLASRGGDRSKRAGGGGGHTDAPNP